jgi:hypothetical protein
MDYGCGIYYWRRSDGCAGKQVSARWSLQGTGDAASERSSLQLSGTDDELMNFVCLGCGGKGSIRVEIIGNADAYVPLFTYGLPKFDGAKCSDYEYSTTYQGDATTDHQPGLFSLDADNIYGNSGDDVVIQLWQPSETTFDFRIFYCPTSESCEASASSPSSLPSEIPTAPPTSLPSEIPTTSPTSIPSEIPTTSPTSLPSETVAISHTSIAG